jgi:hypothetical protein
MMTTILAGPSSLVPCRENSRIVLAERRAADHERGGAGLRALQAREPEQRVEQVADQDRGHRLRHRQAKGHDQRAVEEELHVEHRAGPQPEQSGRGHLPLGVGDQVDPALLDLERGVFLRDPLQRLPRPAMPTCDDVATHRSLQRAQVWENGAWGLIMHVPGKHTVSIPQ